METGWRPDGDQMKTRWIPDGDRMETGWRPNGDRMETGWRPDGDQGGQLSGGRMVTTEGGMNPYLFSKSFITVDFLIKFP